MEQVLREDAQRLCSRYRRLSACDNTVPVVKTAIAREITIFLWAIGHRIA